jgi:hypothetical protein
MKTAVCPDLDYIVEFHFLKLQQFTCFFVNSDSSLF